MNRTDLRAFLIVVRPPESIQDDVGAAAGERLAPDDIDHAIVESWAADWTIAHAVVGRGRLRLVLVSGPSASIDVDGPAADWVGGERFEGEMGQAVPSATDSTTVEPIGSVDAASPTGICSSPLSLLALMRPERQARDLVSRVDLYGVSRSSRIV